MKRFTILLFTFLICSNINATHLMGGELIVQNDQPGDYEILLTLYRDTLGIPMQTTQNIEIYNSSGSVVTTIACNLDLNAFHPVFGLQNGSVLPFFPYGVEVYFFTASFQCAIPGEYTASWDNCCRNSAIINLPNASSADMKLFTNFTVDLVDSYSTPFFMVSPVVFLPMNTPWQYNPLPFDNDGDSLVWSLDVPHESSMANPSHGTPIAGYTNPPSLAGGQFSINPITGTISWTASTIGNFVYTVTCEEFRNGNKVGEIRRDMQFIVLPSGPVPQLIDLGSLPLNADGVPYVNATAGVPFSLNLYALDSSVSSIGFHAFGEPFDLSNPMTYTQGSMDNFQTKVSLMWSPTINEARPEPYAVVLRLMNGTFSMDYTIYVYVLENTTNFDIVSTGEFDIYPNPSHGSANVLISSTSTGPIHIAIFSIEGKKVYNDIYFVNNGVNDIPLLFTLDKGHYIVSLRLPDSTIRSQIMTVQ